MSSDKGKPPPATISRLVTYLRILGQLESVGVKKTSSDHLADHLPENEKTKGKKAFQVRKDLAYFGRFGTRGAGYSVPTLRRELSRILGLTRPWNVAIVGMGHLGHALAGYSSFGQYDFSFSLKAFFDQDPAKVGRKVLDTEIRHPRELPRVVSEKGIDIGFVTVPHAAAQKVADQLVAAGIKGILNFAPTLLNVPKEIQIEHVDFLVGLKRLSFYIQNPHLKE